MSGRTKGLSGSTLKWIAIITMLIDHIGAAIIYPILFQDGMMTVTTDHTLYITYQVMRSIGRVAFPIFCFLLVEGFFHTRDKIKYAIRLGIFALISEVPFDLAFYQHFPANEHQNVFFTLLIGLLMLIGLQYLRDQVFPKFTKGKNWFAFVSQVAVLFVACIIAQLLCTDYGMWGIIAIFGMYVLRFNRTWLCIILAFFFAGFEGIYPAFGFIPIYLYNGSRGIKMKYFFYIFYPAHLLILYLISRYCIMM